MPATPSQIPPAVGFVAPSGTGKTTLLAKLIPLLKASGLRVAVLKRSHHDFEIDHPGKDSHVLRQAGASPVMISSPTRRAIITELSEPRERSLKEELTQFDPNDVDLVLVEGFKHERYAKIQVHRSSLGHPVSDELDRGVIAIASDTQLSPEISVPVLDLNNPEQIARFLEHWLDQQRGLNPPTGSEIYRAPNAPDPCSPIEGDRLMTIEQAIERMSALVDPIAEVETLPLQATHGRVLARPLSAPFPLPPFANSAMDGYAFYSEDLNVASDIQLRLVGASRAGHPFEGSVHRGQCIRILTGAVLPPGLDTVVMQEHVSVSGDIILLKTRPAKGANIRPPGDDAPQGKELFKAGKRLTAVDVGLLASAGIADVGVVRKIRVAHISTGDELTSLGDALDPGKIYDSNRHQLTALLAQPFIESRDFGVVRDDPAELHSTFNSAAGWGDLIISSGGVSVGDADYVTDVLTQSGQMHYWKIAMKPGKPFAFGRIGTAWFCGLPGNPVAVLVSFIQLVRPALLRLAGTTLTAPLRLPAVCAEPIRKSKGRVEFQRGYFSTDESGRLNVVPCGRQGSHRLSGASHANCLIVLPAECSQLEIGESVTIEPLCDVW